MYGTGAAEGDSPIDVGDVTTTQLSGLLVDSETYYSVVTAYDTEGNESSFSNEVSNNIAPQTPTNQSPADGAVDVALSPTLEADAFFDDDGDGHAVSQWQVDVEGGGTVYDSGEDTVNLTSITLPIVLEPMTTYKWRVRYLDSRGRWSQYSETTIFTTVNSPTIVCKTDKPIYNPWEIVQVLADVNNPGSTFSANLLGGITIMRTPPKKPLIRAGEIVTKTIDPGLNSDILLYTSGPVLTAIAPKGTHGAFCVLYTDDKSILAIDTSTWGLTAPADIAQEKFFLNLIRSYIDKYGVENLQNANTEDVLASPVSDVPKKTVLSNAFPTPANPETWFPFQLSEPSDVRIEIHNASGQLVKTLHLGYKEAGYYLNREKAAFWDGKNDRGERVASGIYFYTMRTRNFTATGKVVILK